MPGSHRTKKNGRERRREGLATTAAPREGIIEVCSHLLLDTNVSRRYPTHHTRRAHKHRLPRDVCTCIPREGDGILGRERGGVEGLGTGVGWGDIVRIGWDCDVGCRSTKKKYYDSDTKTVTRTDYN